MTKIMLIDDDEDLHFAVRKVVQNEGYEFCGAHDGYSYLPVIVKEKPDLILLDVMMPKKEGFDVCADIRDLGIDVPIIFLSARSDIDAKEKGFESGGDDYLTKPFLAKELLLRISALMKRTGKVKSSPAMSMAPSEGAEIITVDDLEIHLNEYRVLKRGSEIGLTAKEFEILALLASNPGKVFTRENIYEHIWGERNQSSLEGVTVFIRKIREKIEDNPSQPHFIQTVWRVGYRFCV